MLSMLLVALFVSSVVCALWSGRAGEAGNAVLKGAQDAVSFCFGLAGSLCLWSAVMELAERSGLASLLAKALRPVLRRLFPRSSQQEDVLCALSENVSANLLGLGNAATPAGIRAARGMARLGERGQNELCLLVVVNTASLQLLPTTIAAVRAALGAAAPFDVLPAVWFSSVCSLTAGLGAAALLKRLWR
ncbi:MAG: spore maturation protein A [Oscillospiraceae bacterium]|nr:spore maturation protein A [Oscillospiraceae bacterium]